MCTNGDTRQKQLNPIHTVSTLISGGSTYKSSRHAPPPTGPNSFVFTYVFTKKHLCWRLAPPPTRVGAPPNRKSWIRPCLYTIGGSRGRARPTPPQWDSIFLFSHNFYRKVPTSEVGAPWIRHRIQQLQILNTITDISEVMFHVTNVSEATNASNCLSG